MSSSHKIKYNEINTDVNVIQIDQSRSIDMGSDILLPTIKKNFDALFAEEGITLKDLEVLEKLGALFIREKQIVCESCTIPLSKTDINAFIRRCFVSICSTTAIEAACQSVNEDLDKLMLSHSNASYQAHLMNYTTCRSCVIHFKLGRRISGGWFSKVKYHLDLQLISFHTYIASLSAWPWKLCLLHECKAYLQSLSFKQTQSTIFCTEVRKIVCNNNNDDQSDEEHTLWDIVNICKDCEQESEMLIKQLTT